ncbi:MAG: hypothetical protein ABJL99_17050 [Aliishimia sp.]
MNRTMDTFNDWTGFHRLEVTDVQDIIFAYNKASLIGSPFHERDENLVQNSHPPMGRRDALDKYITPAFTSILGDYLDVSKVVEKIEFQSFGQTDRRIPHTLTVGSDNTPTIVMEWVGTPDDLICLAHEVSHVLQYSLSEHRLMPPVARETCAFLGELIVIAQMKKINLRLFSVLAYVFEHENKAYLGADIEALLAASIKPSSQYHYRQNYPIARLAAIQMFLRGNGPWIADLFASGPGGMDHLPIAEMANRAGDQQNYLPVLPKTVTEKPAVNAYRSLGVMALLDLDYWEGTSEFSIESYYARQLAHLQDGTVFIGLGVDKKPIGYATWTQSDANNKITLTRQAAPFGDHLTLQQLLSKHVATSDGVVSHHDRSGRQEQISW